MNKKVCRKCGNTLPATLEYFYKNKGGKYGLTPRCKPCVNEDNKTWEKANPEKVAENQRKRSLKYYHSDIERGRKIARESAAKARSNPEKLKKIQARKRAGGKHGLSVEELEAIFTSQGHKCAICECDSPPGNTEWNIDHCHLTNKVRFVLCCHCNRGLGAFKDSPELMRKAADLLEKFYEHEIPT